MRPIPKIILRSSAEVEWCTGVDLYQNPQTETVTVHNVHLQPTSAIVKSVSNTDCQLRSVMFADARLSKPVLQWDQMLETAQANGGDVKVTVRGVRYTLMTVDALRDNRDRLHHWELGLM